MLKIQAIGHLGKDALMNNVNGKNVINFSVAHTEKYNGANGVVEKTTWVDCSYWTEKTGIAPYLKKGTQVYVDGTPEVRTFQRNDGTTGSVLAVRVNSVQLLGGGSKEQSAPQPAQQQQPAAPQIPAGNLPF